MFRFNALIVFVLCLCSCATIDQVRYGDPEFSPTHPQSLSRMDVDLNKRSSGGLYSDNTSFSLFETVRAKRVGDILTVVLNEQTQGRSESDTEFSKETSSTIANPTILGKTYAMPSKQPPFILKGPDGSLSLSSTTEFTGETGTEQRNQLTGSITVTVSEVLSNGNLVIRGEKWLNINTGREYIRLKGLVRVADIAPDNTVPSNKIADAQITYSGSGQNHNANLMGWISKFFTSALWLM